MNQAAILEVLKQATKLSLEEQLELNSLLVGNIKRVRKIESIKDAAKFDLGDEVVFDAGPRKGIIKIKITEFSRDGSKLKGPQIGGFRPGCRWTVSAQLVKKA